MQGFKPQAQIGSPTNSLEVLKAHNLRLQVRSHIPHARLSHQRQLIKCLVSIKADDFKSFTSDRYTAFHLICVIDVSGSMQGEKVSLLKTSLEYVISKMTGQDRITLISFNQDARVLAEFAKASEMAVKIQQLKADGTTNIKAGLTEAYKVVLKYANQRMLQSVWLLSDGQDTNGFSGTEVVPHLKSSFTGHNIPFVAHSFGYGRDHDPKIMKAFAQAQSGNFKYISNSLEMADAIGTALGGAESAIARKIVIRVGQGNQNVSRIEKCFGESFEYDPFNKIYSTTHYYFRAGTNLSFVFLVELPAYNPGMLIDPTHPCQILVASAIIDPLNPDDPPVTLSVPLGMVILDPTSPGLPFSPADPQVLEWYFRAVAIDEMRKASSLMDKRDFQQGRKVLQALDSVLERDAPKTEKIGEIRKEVKSMIQNIDQEQYEIGRKRMTEKAMMYEGCYDSMPCKVVEKYVEVQKVVPRYYM